MSGVSLESGTAPDMDGSGDSKRHPACLCSPHVGIGADRRAGHDAHGTEIGRESWSDDGVVVSSEVSVWGARRTWSIDRKKHNHATSRQGEQDQSRADSRRGGGADEPALGGLWRARRAVSRTRREPTPFKVGAGPDRYGRRRQMTVARGPPARARSPSPSGPLEVHATVDAKGAVTHASVPPQGIEVKPTAANAPVVRRAPPAGVLEEPFVVDSARRQARAACCGCRPSTTSRCRW